MKKIIVCMLCCILVLSLVGCGSSETTVQRVESSTKDTVSNVLDTKVKEAETTKAEENKSEVTDNTGVADTSETSETTETIVVQDTNEAQSSDVIDTSESSETSATSENDEVQSSESIGDIDIDLTTLSSTMVYSEVYNMVSQPSSYIGKTVKVKGFFAPYYSDVTKITYYNIIIPDATACCQQGLEFILADGEYPKNEMEEITIVGKFTTYVEDGYMYITLDNAKLL